MSTISAKYFMDQTCENFQCKVLRQQSVKLLDALRTSRDFAMLSCFASHCCITFLIFATDMVNKDVYIW